MTDELAAPSPEQDGWLTLALKAGVRFGTTFAVYIATGVVLNLLFLLISWPETFGSFQALAAGTKLSVEAVGQWLLLNRVPLLLILLYIGFGALFIPLGQKQGISKALFYVIGAKKKSFVDSLVLQILPLAHQALQLGENISDSDKGKWLRRQIRKLQSFPRPLRWLGMKLLAKIDIGTLLTRADHESTKPEDLANNLSSLMLTRIDERFGAPSGLPYIGLLSANIVFFLFVKVQF